MTTTSVYFKWNRVGYLLICSVLLSLSTLILGSNDCYAQTEQVNPRFEAAMEQSKIAASQGKHAEAAEAMRRAISISPVPEYLYDIALFYERAKDWRKALKYYQQFIDRAPSDGRVPEAIKHIQGLQIRLQNQYEEVMITSQPSGAYLYINERANGSVGQTPHRMKLLPGTYKIIAELDGYVPTSQTLKLQEGASSQVALSLYSEREVAPVKFLINRADAQVYVDRRLKGKSPMIKPLLIRQGVREIRITKPGYNTWSKKISVKPQTPMTVDVILVEAGLKQLSLKPKTKDTVTPWIVMGTGAALLGGSVFTGLSAQGLYSDLEARVSEQKLIASQDIEVGNRWVMLTNVLIGLGVTSLTTGGVLWMLDSDDNAQAELSPSLSPEKEWMNVKLEVQP